MNVNGKLSCDTFGDYLNVNGNAPNDLFPLTLNANDMIRAEGSWTMPGNLFIILYSDGMDLLGSSCIKF
jgi:hypothetical protein